MYKVKKAIKLLLSKKKFWQAMKLLKMLYLDKTTKYPAEVLELEKQFSNYLGVKYALSFCNGTSSFDASVFALGLKDNDEVLMCSMSFQSIVMTTLHNRLNIKFLDMDENLNVILDEDKITERTKLLIVSHLFGYPQNMENIYEVAKRYDLKVIEDCSHAHGARYNGKKVGNFGDIAFFSFQGDKAVSGGEAGFAVTNSKNYFDRMKLYSHMGRDMTDIEVSTLFKGRGFGRKGRMHPFAAALASIDLKHLDKNNSILNKNILSIQNILSKYDFIKTIEVNANSELGGFHYGLPLWIETERKALKLLENGRILFRHYPYLDYHDYDFFCDNILFRDKINSSKFTENISSKNESLQMVERAKSHLLFLDIDFIYNFNDQKESFALLMEKIDREN